MFNVNVIQSVEAITYFNKIYHNRDIENVLSVDIDLSRIIFYKSIHNIAIQYSIYEIEEESAYYHIYIKIFNSSGKCIRRLLLSLKNGKRINDADMIINLGFYFYIDDYYITVANNKFSIYKNDKPILTDMDL